MKIYLVMERDMDRHAVYDTFEAFMYYDKAMSRMNELNFKHPDKYSIESLEIVDGDEFNLLSNHHFSLKEYQERHDKWQKRNFGGKHGSGYRPLLGVVEEVGELSHAHLKSEQGIRNNEDHEANKKDAVADIIIYLSDYCTGQGIDLEKTLKETWDQVLKRDWKTNPDTAHQQEEP
jgi:NTP pyrophosphatase (non-canonical NTP hydrolase)